MVFFSKSTKVEDMDAIGNELGIPKTDDLGLYLGVPTINGSVDRRTFKSILDRVDR